MSVVSIPEHLKNNKSIVLRDFSRFNGLNTGVHTATNLPDDLFNHYFTIANNSPEPQQNSMFYVTFYNNNTAVLHKYVDNANVLLFLNLFPYVQATNSGTYKFTTETTYQSHRG